MLKKIIGITAVFLLLICLNGFTESNFPKPNGRFKVLALYENGGHHVAYSKAARIWLDKLASDSDFTVDYIQQPKQITEALLAKYQLFIQLDYPPYGWGKPAEDAFQHYIEQGKGGWIGFHHASLLGEFDGYPIWPWFYQFMGNIRYKNYIETFASAKVVVEQSAHPVMKNVPASFIIETDEWYTYDQNPRSQVQVLAHVDENSYKPNSEIKMGDHPVIWTNPKYKARNIYIFMGHSPDLFQNKAYTTLFRNAIFWAVKTVR
jgi:type 1 glutamine amidotransferase